MGIQKKGTAAVGEKRKGQFQSPKQKMPRKEMTEEVEEMPVLKTPNKAGQTPRQNRSAKKDSRNSFQLQDKNTPKGKLATPASAKGSANLKGQTALREFSVRTRFGAKVQKMISPIKGKVFSPKVKNGMEQDSDDDEEEEDEDIDDDEDDDIDDQEDEGMDAEEDDKDDDDDEEDYEHIRTTLLAIQGKKSPKSNGIAKTEKDTPKANTPKKKTVFETPKATQSPISASKVNKYAATPKSSKPMSPAGSTLVPQNAMALDIQRRRERDLKNLFVRGTPNDVTAEELKAMLPDIVDVNMLMCGSKQETDIFRAFLVFESEQKVEENYALLQTKTLRGQPIFVDFVGEKSNMKPAPSARVRDRKNSTLNKKELVVTGYPENTTIANFAPLFPKAELIRSNSVYRSTFVLFNTEQDALDAFTANSESVMGGKQVTVLFAMGKPLRKGQRSKQRSEARKRNHARKAYPKSRARRA